MSNFYKHMALAAVVIAVPTLSGCQFDQKAEDETGTTLEISSGTDPITNNDPVVVDNQSEFNEVEQEVEEEPVADSVEPTVISPPPIVDNPVVVIAEPQQPPATSTPEVVEAPEIVETPAVVETPEVVETPATVDPEPELVSEPETPVTEEPEPELADEPETPVTEEPEPELADEPETPVTEEPEPELADEPETPVTEEPEPELADEPETPAIEPPTIVNHPKGLVKIEGLAASFSVDAIGEQLTYQWFKNGVPLNINSSAFSIESVTRDDADYYSCTVSNPAGSVNCAEFGLFVWKEVAILEQPSNLSLIEGESGQLKVSYEGHPKATVDWYKDGQLVAEDLPELDLSGARMSDNGIYQCVVTNKANQEQCDPVSVTVGEKTKITLNPINQIVAEGESIQFNIAATGAAPLTYACLKDGQAKLITNDKGELIITDASAEDSGIYSCKVASANGSEAEFNEFELTVMVDNTRDVRVTWQPPTERLNGQPLHPDDIEEYLVHIADSVEGPFQVAATADWSASGATIPDLGMNQFYFIAITTRDINGLESDMSSVVQIRVE